MRQLIKRLTRALLCSFVGDEVRRHPVSQRQSLFHKLQRQAVFEKLERRRDFQKLEDNHQDFWCNEQSDHWYEKSNARTDALVTQHYGKYLEALGQLLDSGEVPKKIWCEVGTGSGRLLEYLVRLHPQVERFVGIDINSRQIARNQVRNRNEKIAFYDVPIQEWVSKYAEPDTLFITNYGVLEYLSQETLCEVFADVAKRLSPAGFALVEPLAHDHDLATQADSRPYGFERSFSHNYPQLLSAAGFNVAYQEEDIMNDQRFIKILAGRSVARDDTSARSCANTCP